MKIKPSIIFDREKQVIKVLFVAYDNDKNETFVIKGKERFKTDGETFYIKDEYIAFEFPLMFYKEFKQGLLEELEFLNWEMKTDDKEMKAVKEHLSDMRKLVFTTPKEQ